MYMLSTKKGLILNLVLSLVAITLVLVGLNYESPNKVKKQSEEEEREEQIRVYLEVNDGTTLLRYDTKLGEDSSLLDFLNALREEKKITFEKTSYSEGEVVESINGLAKTSTFGWVLYINGIKQEQEIQNLPLKKNGVYRYVYEPNN